MSQIQSASACVKKADQDTLSGAAYTHTVYCSSSGAILCCLVDGAGNIQDHSCSVSRMQKKLEGVTTPSTKGKAAAP